MAEGNSPGTLSEDTMDNDKIFDGSDNLQANNGSQHTRPSTSSSCYSDDDNLSPVDVGPQFDNLSHWICCICIVTFDLELGQAIEVLL